MIAPGFSEPQGQVQIIRTKDELSIFIIGAVHSGPAVMGISGPPHGVFQVHHTGPLQFYHEISPFPPPSRLLPINPVLYDYCLLYTSMEDKFEITIDSYANSTWQGKLRTQDGRVYDFQSELQLFQIMARYLHSEDSSGDLHSIH